MNARVPASIKFTLFVAVLVTALILLLRSNLFAHAALARLPNDALVWARDRSIFDPRLLALEYAARIDSDRAMSYGADAAEWWPLIEGLRDRSPADAAAGAYLLSRLAAGGGFEARDDAIRAWLEEASDEATRANLVFAIRHVPRTREETRAVFLPLTEDHAAEVRMQSWVHLKTTEALEARDILALQAAISRETHPVYANALKHILSEWESQSP